MKVLITGVAGFIGSNLAIELLKRNYCIVGVDNLSQGDINNIGVIFNHPNFEFRQIDIMDFVELLDASRDCSVIVHLAAYKIPRYSDATDTLVINSKGSENVVKVAKEIGAKVVAASTSDVYGKNPKIPFSEEDDMVIGPPTVKRWSYAISKMFEEQLFFAYRDRFGLDIVLLRFFGGYGPNQNLTWWGGPQSVFINNARLCLPLEIHGDGQQTRSFTYISDHVDGIISCIEKPEANNLVFNIGNTHPITIEGLAIMIWEMIRPDEEPKLQFIPYSTFGKYEDVRHRLPDISRARQILGFEPKVSLKDGLKKTIEWQFQRQAQLENQ